jgi:hypothetical protein
MARHEHRRRAEEAQRIMKSLLAWERELGGWDAPCWDEARQFVAEGEEDEGTAAADTARRRSEGAKSGWEIRRKKARLTAPERPWRVHGVEPGSRIECRVERWCESHEEALHYAEKFKAEGYVVTVEDRRNA